VGARFSAAVRTDPGTHQASCTKGTGSSLGVKSGRGVRVCPLHPSSAVVKSRAIPLLPLWAVRPVENLNPCTRVHFAFSPSGCIADPGPGFEAVEIKIKLKAKEFAQKLPAEIFTALTLVLYVRPFYLPKTLNVIPLL